MLTWLVYDITENKVRSKVAKLCKEYGLYRVQKSAFLGDLNRNQVDELALRCKELANIEKDSIYLFPLCNEDFQKVRMIGKPFDKELVADEVKSLFL
ncbi:MAG: CRISPR-associated endonuclease Cas2 [bacterium]